VNPLPAATGGGQSAFNADIKTLMGALALNYAGKNAIFITTPVDMESAANLAGPHFDFKRMFASQGLPSGTIIALEPPSFVSGFDPIPTFNTSDTATLNFEDTSPQDITGGTPSPATSVKSLWQADSLSLRMFLRCAFGMRAKGHVQWIQSVSW
jgi:hypothetical protein